MELDNIKQELEQKYPGLEIGYTKRKDGRIDWFFTSPARNKTAWDICAPGITPTLMPVATPSKYTGDWGVDDFYELHKQASNA